MEINTKLNQSKHSNKINNLYSKIKTNKDPNERIKEILGMKSLLLQILGSKRE